jgi:hypothetical protein
MLEAVAQDLWCAAVDLRFLGVHMGTRMTLVRLGDGTLWVHSPIAITDALRAEVDALGKVAHLVAPNLFHHLFVGQWKAAYPDATMWLAPGLERKRPDLVADPQGVVTLGTAPPPWDAEIAQAPLTGFSFHEVLFHHRASRTLVSSDLLENFSGSPYVFTRAYLKLAGLYGRVGVSRVLRWAYRDRPAVKEALARVLAWDFDRIVIAHGAIVEHDAKRALAEAYAWL